MTDKFDGIEKKRVDDKEELKDFLVSTVNTHKQTCDGAQLAKNLATAGKIAKIIYFALPTSVILLVIGIIRSLFNF